VDKCSRGALFLSVSAPPPTEKPPDLSHMICYSFPVLLPYTYTCKWRWHWLSLTITRYLSLLLSSNSSSFAVCGCTEKKCNPEMHFFCFSLDLTFLKTSIVVSHLYNLEFFSYFW